MRYAWRCHYCAAISFRARVSCCHEQVRRNPDVPMDSEDRERLNHAVYGEHHQQAVEAYHGQTFVPVSRRFKSYRRPIAQ